MKFHLDRILAYAHTKENEVKKAFAEFFRDNPPTKELEKDAFPLFSEWLIYDYHQTTGPTFIAEFILKNPHHLSENKLDQYSQIAKTAVYSMFEIRQVARNLWIEVENLFSGTSIRVYDKTSSSIPEHGTLHARIANVDEQWYFVGSNPIYLPNTFTARAKKIFFEHKEFQVLSPKDTWAMIAQKGKIPIPKSPPSLVEIKRKRKELENRYEILAKRYNITLSFPNLLKHIYDENRETAVVDFWKNLCEHGIDEKMFIDQIELFNDIWNYFPHHILGGKSPVEVFTNFRKNNA